MSSSAITDQNSFPFALPDLPYPADALAPYITVNTLNYHHGKHHNTYIQNLNKLLEGSAYTEKSLEEIIQLSSQDESMKTIFNNAAQCWNHSFFWNSLSPNGGGKPSGHLAELIDQSFGDYQSFRDSLQNAASTLFGSGWAWVAQAGDSIKIITTQNAETLVTSQLVPLLTIDVWEHAYYLDFQNSRVKYIETIIDLLLNWEFASENLSTN